MTVVKGDQCDIVANNRIKQDGLKKKGYDTIISKGHPTSSSKGGLIIISFPL